MYAVQCAVHRSCQRNDINSLPVLRHYLPSPLNPCPLTVTSRTKTGMCTGPLVSTSSYLRPGRSSFRATTGFLGVAEKDLGETLDIGRERDGK